MPYEFIPKIGYVHLRLQGQLTVSDLTEVAHLLDKMEATVESSPHRFVDISAVDNMVIDFQALHTFSAMRHLVQLKNNVKTAIVAKTLVQYGCARMFQMLNRQPQTEVQAFRESEAALRWILEAADRGARQPEKHLLDTRGPD